jgi:penicillin-binding protein-related factor A (putative recombinase)
MSKLDESFEEAKARKSKGQRGKSSEAMVEAELQKIKDADETFDFDRLPDTRAAGRIMPARVSDFTLFFRGATASLEVKEVKSGDVFKVDKKSLSQLPRMKRRALAGCRGFVLVHFLEKGGWAMRDTAHLEYGAKLVGDYHGEPLSAKVKNILRIITDGEG